MIDANNISYLNNVIYQNKRVIVLGQTINVKLNLVLSMILQNHIVLVIVKIIKYLMDLHIDVYRLLLVLDVRQFLHANLTIKYNVLDHMM